MRFLLTIPLPNFVNLGSYIKVKHTKYRQVVESHLSQTLNALGVETHEDMKLLQQVLDQFKWYMIHLFVVYYKLRIFE